MAWWDSQEAGGSPVADWQNTREVTGKHSGHGCAVPPLRARSISLPTCLFCRLHAFGLSVALLECQHTRSLPQTSMIKCSNHPNSSSSATDTRLQRYCQARKRQFAACRVQSASFSWGACWGPDLKVGPAPREARGTSPMLDLCCQGLLTPLSGFCVSFCCCKTHWNEPQCISSI